MKQIKVLIVDDSAAYRKLLEDVIGSIPNVSVVGVAQNGFEAIEMLTKVKPDFITLDLEMPVLNGFQTLLELDVKKTDYKVVMISAYTINGAKTTIKALEYGAYDFIAKPFFDDRELNKKYLINSLKRIFFGDPDKSAVIQEHHPVYDKPNDVSVIPKVVAIGASTGGPGALTHLFSSIPENFPVPILIVQHMPELFTQSLSECLNRKSRIPIVEAKHGMAVKPRTAIVAPGGLHMKLAEKENGEVVIELSDEPPEQNFKPSINNLFRSVAKVYKKHAVGIILTGMGTDGVLGLKLMKRHGAFVIGQDQATSAVYGMPREAFNAGLVDLQLPINEIGPAILMHIKTVEGNKKTSTRCADSDGGITYNVSDSMVIVNENS